jgi:hypothetical protein
MIPCSWIALVLHCSILKFELILLFCELHNHMGTSIRIMQSEGCRSLAYEGLGSNFTPHKDKKERFNSFYSYWMQLVLVLDIPNWKIIFHIFNIYLESMSQT